MTLNLEEIQDLLFSANADLRKLRSKLSSRQQIQADEARIHIARAVQTLRGERHENPRAGS